MGSGVGVVHNGRGINVATADGRAVWVPMTKLVSTGSSHSWWSWSNFYSDRDFWDDSREFAE